MFVAQGGERCGGSTCPVRRPQLLSFAATTHSPPPDAVAAGWPLMVKVPKLEVHPGATDPTAKRAVAVRRNFRCGWQCETDSAAMARAVMHHRSGRDHDGWRAQAERGLLSRGRLGSLDQPGRTDATTAGWRVAANTAPTTAVGHGQSRPRVAMAVRGTSALLVLVSCIDQTVGIDAQLARRSARMDLSPSCRTCPAARLRATGAQHLAQVLQGMRGSA